ncbi:MAG: hypothetical protein KGP14_14875 [Betaproteobacteria bacterium]|nr:hypothetical protein [Betaproteobacteria bacterium]
MMSPSIDPMNAAARPILSTDWIASHANFNPERTALIDVPGFRRQTYRELHQRIVTGPHRVVRVVC